MFAYFKKISSSDWSVAIPPVFATIVILILLIVSSSGYMTIDTGYVLVFDSKDSVKNYKIPIKSGRMKQNKPNFALILHLDIEYGPTQYRDITAEWQNGGLLKTGKNCILLEGKRVGCEFDDNRVLYLEPYDIVEVSSD